MASLNRLTMTMRWLARLGWAAYLAVFGAAAAVVGLICGLVWSAAGGGDPLVLGVGVGAVFLAGFIVGRGEIQIFRD